MDVFLLILFGFLSGVVGGMGMGGGTLLVPLLSFLDLEQKTIQAINLIGFLPMSVAALGLHAKNHLIKKQRLGWLVVPAVLAAVGGAFLTGYADGKLLRIFFAIFLVGVGVWQLALGIKSCVERKKQKGNSERR